VVVILFVRVFCAHVCVCEKELVGKGGRQRTGYMYIRRLNRKVPLIRPSSRLSSISAFSFLAILAIVVRLARQPDHKEGCPSVSYAFAGKQRNFRGNSQPSNRGKKNGQFLISSDKVLYFHLVFYISTSSGLQSQYPIIVTDMLNITTIKITCNSNPHV